MMHMCCVRQCVSAQLPDMSMADGVSAALRKEVVRPWTHDDLGASHLGSWTSGTNPR